MPDVRDVSAEKSEMTKHLRTHGFMPNFNMPINFAQRDRGREDVIRQRVAGYEDDGVRDMLDDVFAAQPTPPSHSANEPEEPEETAKAFLKILASSNKPLYEGAKLSVLDARWQSRLSTAVAEVASKHFWEYGLTACLRAMNCRKPCTLQRKS